MNKDQSSTVLMPKRGESNIEYPTEWDSENEKPIEDEVRVNQTNISLHDRFRVLHNSAMIYPARIAHFDVLQELGEGAYARVFHVYNTDKNRISALKVAGDSTDISDIRRLAVMIGEHPDYVLTKIKNGVEEYAAALGNLEHEAMMLTRVRHHNIARMYQAMIPKKVDGLDVLKECEVYRKGKRGRELVRAYIELELIEGGSLRKQLKKGAFKEERVARLASGIMEALHHIHRLNIVHHDIKPDNILIEEGTDRPVLIDWGIATFLIDGKCVTDDPACPKGTPPYVPPELCSGDMYTAASDVYSAGVTLYEALGGEVRKPKTKEEAIHIIVNKDYEPLEERTDFRKAVNRMIKKDPGERLTTREVLKILEG